MPIVFDRKGHPEIAQLGRMIAQIPQMRQKAMQGTMDSLAQRDLRRAQMANQHAQAGRYTSEADKFAAESAFQRDKNAAFAELGGPIYAAKGANDYAASQMTGDKRDFLQEAREAIMRGDAGLGALLGNLGDAKFDGQFSQNALGSSINAITGAQAPSDLANSAAMENRSSALKTDAERNREIVLMNTDMHEGRDLVGAKAAAERAKGGLYGAQARSADAHAGLYDEQAAKAKQEALNLLENPAVGKKLSAPQEKLEALRRISQLQVERGGQPLDEEWMLAVANGMVKIKIDPLTQRSTVDNLATGKSIDGSSGDVLVDMGALGSAVAPPAPAPADQSDPLGILKFFTE